jgi:hypothetical protein
MGKSERGNGEEKRTWSRATRACSSPSDLWAISLYSRLTFGSWTAAGASSGTGEREGEEGKRGKVKTAVVLKGEGLGDKRIGRQLWPSLARTMWKEREHKPGAWTFSSGLCFSGSMMIDMY